jgi:outer membrane receptor protein involved in Fe transport
VIESNPSLAAGDGRRSQESSRQLTKHAGLKVSALASAVAVLVSGPAFSQQGTLEEVTVTGSRITRTTGFATAVPVTAVTTDDLASFEPGTTITDQLDNLPQFFNTQSPQRGGGALFGQAGRSALELRSMGRERTLVLLDGARLSPADRDGSVHVDNIPTALLQQVEIVTGGASAAYGADALAGVVNFRLNRNYEGLDFSVGGGRTDSGEGANRNFSVAYGTPIGDRLHFIGSVENQKIDPIQFDPDELGGWFQRYGIVANPAWSPGNTSVPARLVLPDVHSTIHTPTGRIGVPRNAAGVVTPFSLQGFNFTYDGAGVRPFVPGDVVSPVGGTSNQSGGPEAAIANLAFNTPLYGAEVVRSNFFAGLTFDANESTRFFVNVLGGSTESNDYNQRGIPHLTSPWTGSIFVDNPFLPANVRQTMIDEGINSFVFEKQGQVAGQEGNWNDNETRHNQYDGWTLQLGLDKDLGDNWNLQARIQRGSTDRYTSVINEVRVDRTFLALDAVEVYPGTTTLVSEADRGTGVIICNVQRFNPTPEQFQAAVAGFLVPAPHGDDSLGAPSDLVPIPGPIGNDNSVRDCVPMNAFGQGNVSAAAADYVVSPKAGISAVTQEFAEILLTGDIWEGFGPGPFSMAVGTTWREQWFWQRGLPVDLMAFGPPRNADGSAASNFIDLGIRGIQGGFTQGSANLHEFSTVPVISGGYDVWEVFTEFNLPLWESASGAQRFELDLAARYSDYSTSGGINSHKAGINFQIAEPLRFRATASRDVREPTFAERFNLQGGGGSVIENGETFQITTTTGGNPDLAPEEADTVTAGFVFQPQNTGFQFSVDWYEIDVDGFVGSLGVQRIVDECNNGVTSLCGLIQRDPLTNAVTTVRNVSLNVNKAKVRGLDYELLWSTEPDWLSNQSETLTVRLLAGRLLEDSTTVTTAAGVPQTTDLAGNYAEPDFTALASARYQIGAFGINLQQRYIGESMLNGLSNIFVQFEPGRVPGPNQFTLDDATVQSKSYTDLTLYYDGELSNGRTWQASFAITNLFDTEPPIIAAFDQRFSAQTAVANNFDVYGRRFVMNFRYRL